MSSLIKVVKGHICFPVPDPERVKAVFPHVKVGKVNGIFMCAVPHDLQSARFFNNNGKPVPSPILTEYDWPGRVTPYEHQKATAEFLTLNPRAYCLNGMGTGKTKSALWSTDFMMRAGDVEKCLIVAPLSTLERVWGQEIFETLLHRGYNILHGSRQKRFALLEDRSVDFYIINHDGIEIIADELAKRPDVNHVILDESAVFRNIRTQRAKTMFHILNRQGIARSCWGLTGTPTPTAPTDCFGQIRLVTPERYKSSFKSIQNELMWQITQFKWVSKPNAATRVNELMQPSIRYALEDCIDLPPTIYQERQCELSGEQKKHYEELRRKAFTEIDGTPISAINAGVLLNKLVQAACGVLYDGMGGVKELDFGPRLNVLTEVIEESDQKVIIFVPLTGVLNALYDKLKKNWTVEIIDGSVSAGKRNQVFRDFQNSKNPHILLAHPGTMAHGLTLTAATTICWFAPITSNELFQQANARIARPGQTKVTNIVMIEGSPVERGLYQTLKERGKLQDLVLNLAKGGV